MQTVYVHAIASQQDPEAAADGLERMRLLALRLGAAEAVVGGAWKQTVLHRHRGRIQERPKTVPDPSKLFLPVEEGYTAEEGEPRIPPSAGCATSEAIESHMAVHSWAPVAQECIAPRTVRLLREAVDVVATPDAWLRLFRSARERGYMRHDRGGVSLMKWLVQNTAHPRRDAAAVLDLIPSPVLDWVSQFFAGGAVLVDIQSIITPGTRYYEETNVPPDARLGLMQQELHSDVSTTLADEDTTIAWVINVDGTDPLGSSNPVRTTLFPSPLGMAAENPPRGVMMQYIGGGRPRRPIRIADLAWRDQWRVFNEEPGVEWVVRDSGQPYRHPVDRRPIQVPFPSFLFDTRLLHGGAAHDNPEFRTKTLFVLFTSHGALEDVVADYPAAHAIPIDVTTKKFLKRDRRGKKRDRI